MKRDRNGLAPEARKGTGVRVAASLVRGGTSKCWLFDVGTLQDRIIFDPEEFGRLLVAAYGAADADHVDGVGGATPTTSKAAFVQPSITPGIDVEYLFGQVGIGEAAVEWGSNCGNCATAIALWAVSRGLVVPTGDVTTVLMRNSNTGSVLHARVDTPGGQIQEFGSTSVPGTSAGGVGVGLTFLDPAGATTGELLPTGRATEILDVDGVSVQVSMVDAGAPVVFVDAATFGASGSETPAQLEDLVPKMRRVRHLAAERMGLARAERTDDAVPKVGLAAAPSAEDHDISVRMLSMNAPHPAIGMTSAVTVAVANGMRESVIGRSSAAAAAPHVRIGTPSGVVTVASADPAAGVPRRVTVHRAARILCDAEIRVPDRARI